MLLAQVKSYIGELFELVIYLLFQVFASSPGLLCCVFLFYIFHPVSLRLLLREESVFLRTDRGAVTG